ncbi:MAG: site-specific integrase [Candidatus Sulfotelmatobacter sp.]
MMARRRALRGEGSLMKIYGPKDAVTGEKIPISKNWYAQYYGADGRQHRVSTGTPVQQKAAVFLRKLLTDRDAGRAPATEARKLTYANLRKGLLDNYVERGNRSLKTTADGEESINGLKQLDDFFGYGPNNPGLPVRTITTETGRKFTRQRLAEGVGTAMINRSLACLRRMLRIAQEEGRIHFVPKIRLQKEPPARKGFLEMEKFNQLLRLLPTHLRPLITLLYYCGVRVGEALQIEWPQVDLEAQLIMLAEHQTKNAEARTVPLPSVLVMMLAAIEPKRGKVFSDTNLRTEWQKACAACGLGTRTLVKPEDEDSFPWYKYEGLIVHDLRRSAVRNLVNSGVPERVAMKISGHKTRAVFDRYHIVSTDDVTKAMRRVELNEVVSESLVKVPRQSARSSSSILVKTKG